jgi:hypothetical protein
VPSPLFKREAIGLNERWRFYRYEPGQTFKMHFDGSVKRDNGERSQVTFMIYLNQDSEGGETRFELPGSQEIITVVPRTGMALLFLLGEHLRPCPTNRDSYEVHHCQLGQEPEIELVS